VGVRAGELALVDSLDPALRARAEAARALLREDPAVDRHLLFAAVVWPREPMLEHAQPRGRRLLSHETVEHVFERRETGVSFGVIATEVRVCKSTVQAIVKLGREEALKRHEPATNGDGITDGKLASLIAVELKRKLANWKPFPPKAGSGQLILSGPKPRPPRTACLRGHEFTTENTVVRPDGSRTCRTCRRASSLAHYHRQRPTANGNGGATSLQPDDLARLIRLVLEERLTGWAPFSSKRQRQRLDGASSN
jgi:hypothetical protein